MIAFAFVVTLIVCVFFYISRKNAGNISGIDRQAELANIRKMQNQEMYKQQIWKNVNGLSQVDEEGESYVTAHSDYRMASNKVPMPDYYEQPSQPA